MAKIAVLRVKGRFGLKREFNEVLDMLGLKSKNHCVILEDSPNNMGMLKQIKDFIAYGEVKDEVLTKLSKKKKPIYKSASRAVYALPNPKKGFAGIKRGYGEGGDLGYRGEKINELLERMIANI